MKRFRASLPANIGQFAAVLMAGRVSRRGEGYDGRASCAERTLYFHSLRWVPDFFLSDHECGLFVQRAGQSTPSALSRTPSLRSVAFIATSYDTGLTLLSDSRLAIFFFHSSQFGVSKASAAWVLSRHPPLNVLPPAPTTCAAGK